MGRACGRCGIYLTEPTVREHHTLLELALAQHDRRALLARLDDLERERDAIAQGAKATITALNAAVGRIAEQRDADHTQLKAARDYLERLPTRTPERERLITAMTARIGPAANTARIDELP